MNISWNISPRTNQSFKQVEMKTSSPMVVICPADQSHLLYFHSLVLPEGGVKLKYLDFRKTDELLDGVGCLRRIKNPLVPLVPSPAPHKSYKHGSSLFEFGQMFQSFTSLSYNQSVTITDWAGCQAVSPVPPMWSWACYQSDVKCP